MNRLKSPVRIYLRCNDDIAALFSFVCGNNTRIVLEELDKWRQIYQEHFDEIKIIHLEYLVANPLFPLYEYTQSRARIEYGAIIRSEVELADDCIILMGAVINKGAEIGHRSMIDMNAVIGSGAIIKDDCHISAGAVLAGMMEPISTTPVIIENNVFIGANAIVLEGVHVYENAIIGAGAVVTKDVPNSSVVYGNPAHIIRKRNNTDSNKINLNPKLRK